MTAASFNGVMFFSATKESTVYASNQGLYRDASGKIDKGEWAPSDVFKKFNEDKQNSEDIEREFLEVLSGIVLQTILIMQTRPNLLEMGGEVGFGTAVKGKNKITSPKSCNLLVNPNWIGRTYQPPSERVHLGGTHASPRSHWRTGYTRLVAFGKGRTGRYPHWFEPVFVNS